MAHAEFSPSQLHRIIACPSSVQLYRELKPVNTSSSYAEEGTLLHSYMDKIMQGEMALQDIPDPEHRETCADAERYVRQYLQTEDHILQTELQVEVKDVPVWGTADVVIRDLAEKRLHVMDYKFGAGVRVEVENNPQFQAYALGVYDRLGLSHNWPVTIHVIQPRLDHYAHVDTNYNILNEWKQKVLVPAIAQANSDEEHFHPSPEACRWCLCKAMCPACHTSAQEAAQVVFQAYSMAKEGKAISKSELAEFYARADELQAQIKAVQSYVLTELMAGRSVPGYKLGYTRGRRAFTNEDAVSKLLLDKGLDFEEIFETELKSPAKLEKICKELKKDEEFQSLITMSSGNPKVCKDDDDSVETNPFSKVTEKEI